MQGAYAWLGIFAVALAYEVTALVKGWPTLSATTWKYAAKMPLIPFLAGIVCGHLFWQC